MFLVSALTLWDLKEYSIFRITIHALALAEQFPDLVFTDFLIRLSQINYISTPYIHCYCTTHLAEMSISCVIANVY